MASLIKKERNNVDSNSIIDEDGESRKRARRNPVSGMII
jgi:hypothetical protein